MKTSVLGKQFDPRQEEPHELIRQPEPGKGVQAHLVRAVRVSAVPTEESLRMFTEEEVSDILQVSLSQLRKWRMKSARRNGPPFKKIGRLVRYPGQSLRAYVNEEDQ